jgi:hypothetical protein
LRRGRWRKIFGLKSDEVREGWRKLRVEVLHNLFSSKVISGSNEVE